MTVLIMVLLVYLFVCGCAVVVCECVRMYVCRGERENKLQTSFGYSG